MILCIEQAGTLHVVYEIQEPANGGIGALTEADLSHARALRHLAYHRSQALALLGDLRQN
jgi:hypothetical protein